MRLSLTSLLATTSLSAVGSLFLAPSMALANPQGGSVVSGGASIVQSTATPNRLVIDQTTESVVLNWQSFSIGAGEQVIFEQPNAAAIALNRVTGNQISEIAGTLTANGQVWLVNPNGVFFGQGAVVNVAGIVATTSGIGAANFMAGKYVFDRPGAPGATVVNAGEVNVRDGGLAAFVAPGVANSGVINARLGKVALASGSKFTIDLYGDNLVKFAVGGQAATALAGAAVDNSGKIKADGGTVTLSVAAAQSIVDHAINIGGTIEARTASMQDGKIVLNGGGGTVTVGGTLDASGTGAGQTGGTVEVLGGAVNLASGASVNVSGDAGGGTALIGGNFHGAGPQPNAATTTVAEGAVIDADAVSSGNGGDVAVWADQATVFDGSITARGGAAGGNGGFVETSGKQNLSLGTLASVDTRAPKGTTGTWLLDPSSILIDDTDPGGDDDIATDTTDYPNFLTTGTVASGDGSSGGTAAAYLSPTALVTQLTTTNVSLSATTSITFGTNTGIAAGITSASGNSLTLNAGTTIDFAAAANLISISGGIKATASNVILGTSLSGGAGGVDLSGSTTDTLAASVTLTATNGAIKLGGNVVGAGADTLTLTPGAAGTVTLQAVGDTTAVAALSVTNGTTTLDGDVTTTGTQTYSGAVTIGGNDTLTTTNSLVDFASTVDDTVAGTHSLAVATGTGGVTFGAAVGTTALLSLDTTGTSGTITLDASVTTATTQTYAGPVTIGGNDTLTTTNSLVDFASTVDDATANTDSLAVAAGSGGVTFAAAVGAGTRLASLDTTGTSGTITLDASVTTGGGGQTYAGPVLLGGSVALTDQGGGTIAFSSTLTGGGNAITIIDNTPPTFASTVSGLSAATLAPFTAANTVAVGDSSLEPLTAADTQYDFVSTGPLFPLEGAVAGAVTIGSNTTTGGITMTQFSPSLNLALENGGTGAISVTGVYDGTGSLVLTSGSGGITLDTSVTTTGTQTYSSAVTIGGNDTLTTTNSLVDFASTVDDATANTDSLAVAAGSGGVTFAAAVGAGTRLASLDTTGTSGTITLDASVTTGGTQTYAGPTVIGGDDTLTTTNALVDFASTVDDAAAGTHSLVVATGTGGVTFAAAVGTTKLLSLDTTGTSGTITLDASVTTASTQTYAGPVVIGGNDTLTTTNSLVDFASTVDDAVAGTHSLVVATGTGGVTFTAAVGTTKLLSLDTTGTSGTITLDASVTTASTQTYAGPVVIGGDDTLTTTNALVDFASTVDDAVAGTHSLVVATGTGGVTFAAAVGTTELLSLDTTGTSGTITLDANVTTGGTQTYAGKVTIGGNDTLTTTNSLVDFGSTVNDSATNTHSLIVAAGSGGVTIVGAVGATKELASLDVSGATGPITLDANVKTGGTQTYAGPVTIGGNDTLTTTNALVDFANTVDDATADTHSLIVASGSGGVTVAAVVGATKDLASLDVTGATGTITLDASVTTGGTQTYAGPVTIAANDTLTTTNSLIDFGGTVDDGTANTHGLVVASGSGGLTITGAVGATKELASLDTTGTSGTITLDANVTTGGTQTYAGPVTIGGNDTLTTTNSLVDFASTVDDATANTHSLIVASGSGGATFAAAVGATKDLVSLDVSGATGTIALDGSVTTGGTQTYAGPVTVAGNDTLTTTNSLVSFGGTVNDATADTHGLTVAAGTGGVTFAAAIGATKDLASLDTTGTSGTITLDANVTTGGTQTYAGLTVIGGNDTLTTTNSLVSFGSTVNDATANTHSLVLATGTGGVTIAGAVGATTPLASLDTTGTSGTITLDGSVTTGGTQTYAAPVTIGGNDTLTTTNALVDFTSTVDDATADTHSLTVASGTGGVTFAAAVGATKDLASLDTTGTSGAITLDAGVTTGGTQTYAGAVTIGSNDTLTTTNALVDFAGTVNDATANTHSLTIASGSGGATFTGAIGATKDLASLDVTGATGTTTLDASVTTGGTQTYAGKVTIGGNDTLTTTNSLVDFGSTVNDSATNTHSLIVAAGSGGVTIVGAVGATKELASLDVSGATGPITLDANVKTGGTQTYAGPVTIGGNDTLTTTNALVDFANTVDDATADTHSLIVASGSGGVTVAAVVGATKDLASLDVTGATGTITLDASVTTGGTQTYAGPVTIAANDTLTTTNSLIDFGGTVDDGTANTHGLVVASGSGGLTITGAVGATKELASLDTTGTSGTITLDANVTTGGTQTYAGPVTIGGNDTLTTTNSLVDFASTVDDATAGTHSLTITAGTGGVTVTGAVGATKAPASLSATGTTIALDGSVSTTGAQSYTDTTLDLDGATYKTTTSGAFTETGATVLTDAVTVNTSAGNQNISFNGAIDDASAGGQALNLNAGTGTIALSGAVGSGTALGAITLSDGQITIAANLGITTSDAAFSQTGATLLQGGTNQTLTVIATSGGNIGFSGTIDGTSAGKQALSLGAGAGTIVLSGSVGSSTALGAVTLAGGVVAIDASVSGAAIGVAGSSFILFDHTGGAAVTSTGGQTYAGAITLQAATSLTDTGGSAITFENTIDGTASGGQALAVSTAGGTIALSGAVGSLTPLGAVTLTDAALDIGANIGVATSDGAFSQTGATLLQGSTNGTSTAIATANGNIGFSGTIDGASAGSQALLLNAGTGTIALSGNVGSGLALASLSLTDARLDLSADVTLAGNFSQTGSTLLQGGAGATVTTIASSVGEISFSSTIDGDLSGKRSLVLTAGDSTIALQGSLGATTALGAVTLADQVLDLAANVGVTTSDAAFSQTGATLLQGGTTASATTINTSNGDITFSSTVSGTGTGAQALTLTAGTGTIALQGSLGTGSALGVVTLSDAVLDLSPNIGITTSGAAFSQTGATVLLGASATATTIATSGGNIGFSSTIDGTTAGEQSLTLNAGGGTIALSGAVGASVALGAVALVDAELTLGPNVGIATSGGAFSQTGATVLEGGTNATTDLIDTTASGSTGANISFSSAIDGTNAGSQALDLAAGSSGTIALSGNVGVATALGAVTLNAGGPIAIANTLTTSGGTIFVTSGSNISITAPVDAGVGGGISLAAAGAIDVASALGATATGTITLAADTGQTGNAADGLTIAAAVGNLHAGTMSLTGAAITLGATVDGGGALSIAPSTGSANIGLGDGANSTADTFHLAASGVANIGTDFTAVSIATTGGSVAVDNSGASLLLHSPLTLAGTGIALFSGLSTTGKSIALTGPITLANTVALDTTSGGAGSGGNITFTSAVNAASAGAQGLTLDAGTAGTIALSASIGAATALGAVTFTDKTLDLALNVGITTANAAFDQSGATLLQGGTNAGTTTIATSGGTITFGGGIDATAPGAQALVLDAGAGTIALSGSIGSGTALGAITFIDDLLEIAANTGIATSGAAFAQSGATVLQAGAGATATTIATSGGNITFGGAIDGGSAGEQALTLNAGTGTIAFSGNLGSATALGAVTLLDQVLALAANVGIATSNAAFSETGATVLGGAGATAATISTSGGNLTFAGAIDGTTPGLQALTLNAGSGTGTIALSGALGAGTALGAVTLNDAVLDLAESVGVTTSNGAFSQTGATVLQGGTNGGATTIATSGGNIAFAGTIDGTSAGAQTLSLDAGAGTIALSGGIGAGKALGAIALSDAVLDLANDADIATSDATFSQTGATVLQGGTTTIATTGGNITFTGTIDATSMGQQALTLNAGTGTIALTAAIGAATALGAITLTDNRLEIAANVGIATSDAAFSQTGATVLQAGTASTATTIATSGGNITLGGAVDGAVSGDQALTLGAGTGTIALSGSVGAATALGAVTLQDQVLTLAANVGITTADASISQSGATVLGGAGASATTIATSGGTITFGGAIDGAVAGDQALTLNAGAGTVALDGNVGSATALGAVTLTDAVLDIPANVGIATSHAAISQSGATLLEGGTNAGATTLATSGGNITFTGTIDGTSTGQQALTLSAGTGTIALTEAVGAATALGAMTFTDNRLEIAANIGIATSDAAFSQTGATVLGGTAATATTIATSGGNITFGGAIDGAVVGDQALTLNAGTGTVALSGSVGAATALGAVTLLDQALTLAANVGITTADAPVSQSGATVLGGAGASASTLATSGGNITFGGAIDGTVAGDQALTLNAGAGTIALDGTIGSATALGAVTLSDAVLDIAANVGVATSHAAISQSGSTLLDGGTNAGATTFATTGGNIAFTGTIDATSLGQQALTLTAGTGTIALNGNVGSATALGAVTLTDGALDLAASVGIATADAALSQTGATVLEGGTNAGTTTIATAGGTISFGGTIDGTHAGDQALTLDAGAGTITLSGSLGSTTKLGAVTLIDTTLTLAPNVGVATAGAAISESGATLLGGTGASATTFATSGGNIGFGGPIDAAVAGDQGLSLAAGGGTIALAANVGAATPLGAVTLSDGLLTLAPNIGIATSNAAITQTGATALGGTIATATTIASSGGTIAFTGTIDGTTADQQALVLSAGSGTIALSGNVGAATPLGAVTLTDALLTITGSVEIATGGAALSQSGASVLAGGAGATSVTVATSGGDIAFAGNIDGDGVAARSLGLAAGTGTITLSGNVGIATPLGAVTLTDAVLDLGANVGIATADAALSQSGATVLGGTAATATTIATSGGNIAFGSTIDGTVPGDQALTLNAGAGTIALNGNLGSATPLGAVTIIDGALDLAANVGIATADAAISLTGATTLGGTSATATTLASTGGDITIAGSVDGTTAGDQALILAADTGTIALTGTIGKNTGLAALTLLDGALDIGANSTIATAGGAFIEAGPFVLPGGTTAGTVTIDTTDGGALPGGANITFSSTIDASGEGKQGLTLVAGAGTVALQGNVGAATPLAALTMSDAVLDLAANIAITTAGGAVTQTGPTVLGGGTSPTTTTVDTTAGGLSANIGFNGTIDGGAAGAQALILTAGAGGTVSLLGNVGGGTLLGAVTLSGGAIDLGANVGIATLAGAVAATGPVVLLGGTNGSSVSIATQGGAIAFSSTIDASTAGDEALSLTASTGTISLQGNVGAATALGAITLGGAIIDLAGNIAITTAGGAIALNASALLVGAGATAATIDTTQAAHAAGADITLVSLDGSLAGDQALTLNTGTGGTISVQAGMGAATALGALTLSDAALDLAADAGITTAGGAVSQTGAIVLGGGTTATLTVIDTTDGGQPGGANITIGAIDASAAGAQAVRLASGTGTIALLGTVGGATALGAVTLSDATLRIGPNVSLFTSGGAIDQSGATVLLGAGATSTLIETTATVTFGGTIDGSLAGKQSLAITGGTISLAQSLGATTPLGALSLDGTAIDLGPDLGVTTAAGAVSITGGIAAASAVTIDTTAGATKPGGAGILFSAGFDGGALTLNAGTAGTITLDGALGATTPLAAVTLSDAVLDLGANVTIATADGAFAQTGAAVLLAGTAPSLDAIDTTGGNITFAGTIDAAASGAQALTLDADGPGTIALQANVGKTTPLGALSMTDALLELGPNVGIVTAGGAVSNSGPVILLPGAGPTATTIATTGGSVATGANITFGAGISGSSPGAQALTLIAGSQGMIALAQTLGVATALGAVTVSAASIDLAAGVGIDTSGGAVSVTGAMLLAGPGATTTLIDTTNAGQSTPGANISLAGSVDGSTAGAQALTLTAGTAGTITLAGVFGGATALGAVTLSDKELDLAANVGIATSDAAFSQSGDTVLQGGAGASATTIATSGGAIGFAAAIDGTTAGTRALTLNAGSGTITLSGAVGARTALGAVTLADAVLNLAPDVGITTFDAAFAQTGATVLQGGTTATATTIATSGGAIGFAGTIDGTSAGDQALVFNAGTGTIALSGAMGAGVALGAITLADAELDLAPNVDVTTSGAAFSQTGATVLLGAAAGATVIDTTAGGTVAGGANIAFAGNIEGGTPGPQALTLNAGTFGVISVGTIGDATALGALSFTDATLQIGASATIATSGGAIAQTGATVLIGAGATADVIGTASLADPAGANIAFNGPIDGSVAGKQALTLTAGTGGTIALAANLGQAKPLGALSFTGAALVLAPNFGITTKAGSVSVSGATLLAGSAVIDATAGAAAPAGASIAFAGTIDGGTLSLNAGTGGTIALGGTIGGATPLGALTLTDGELDLAPNITIATAGGAVSQTGTTVLEGGTSGGIVTIDTATGADITFSSTIDGSAPGAEALALNAGAGTIALQGNIGTRTALGALTLSDAVLDLPGNAQIVTAGGAVAETGVTLLFGASATAATIDTTNGGALPAGASITFAGTLDGGVAGKQAVTLNAGSSGTVGLLADVGATTALGAVTLTDAALLLAANAGLTTAGGAVAETGATILQGTGPTATAIDTTNGGTVGAGANITLTGTVDGNIAGDQALTLNAGTGGTIALTADLGGTTALGALTMSDSVLLLGTNANITTAGGAVTETGATVGQPTLALADLTLSLSLGVLVPVELPLTPMIDTTGGGAAPAGANIRFNGTIDQTALMLNAGTGGTIALTANVGGRTPLFALTLADAELDIAPDVSVATEAYFTQTGATVLLGGTQSTLTTITATEGLIAFNGTIDASAPGRQALTLDAGAIELQGNIGSRTPLGALSLDGAAFAVAPNLTITTSGGAFTETETPDLVALTELQPNGTAPTSTVIDTTAGGTVPTGANITFAGNLTGESPGAQSLSLVAGSGGTIALAGFIGVTPLGALNFTDAVLTVGTNGGLNSSTIVTAGGAITQTGATLLTSEASPSSPPSFIVFETQGGGGPGAPGANITFTGTIDAAGPIRPELVINAGVGGTIALRGNVGASTALAGVTLSDSALELAAGVSVSVLGGTILDDFVSVPLDDTFLQTGATVLLAGTAPTTTTINATNVTFAGSLDAGAAGAQALTLDAGAGTITLGGNIGAATPLGALALNDTVLALGPGVTVTTSGGAIAQTGATTLLGGTSATASLIDTTAGGAVPLGANVTFGGAIEGTAPGAQSLALNAGTAGTIALQANVGATVALGAFSLRDAVLTVPARFSIATAGGAVSETGATLVAGGASPASLTVDTTGDGAVATGADIAIGAVTGGASGTLTLALDAGTGGTVDFLGNLGATAALAALTLSDAGLVIGPNVNVTTAGTPFDQPGATVLLANGTNPTLTTIDTTNGGTKSGAGITFGGAIDGGAAGRQALTLDAGSADIALGGSVGAAAALGALTLNDATLRLGAGIGIATAGGAFAQSGTTVLLDPPPVGTIATVVTIDTAAGGVSAGAGISFGAAIDGTTVGGQALTLNAGSAGTVSLPDNVGASVPLGGLNLTGNAINLGGSLYQTVQGAISTSGLLNFAAPLVTIATVLPNASNLPATTGATISLAAVSGPTTTLTLDPGIDSVAIFGGTLQRIVILEGTDSTLTLLTVGSTSLGGSGVATGMTVAGLSGAFAASAAFIRPGGVWTVNADQVLITDPALAGLTDSVLSVEGVSTAIALMVQIQQLIARGDTGETAAQQAFLQSPDRADYAVDPFHQRYNILGVAQENVGGFEDLSYVTDGFWEGLLKK